MNSYLPCRLGIGMYSWYVRRMYVLYAVSIHYRLTRRVACVRACATVRATVHNQMLIAERAASATPSR